MKCFVTVHFSAQIYCIWLGMSCVESTMVHLGTSAHLYTKKIQVMSELLWALISSQLQKDISSKKLQHALDMVICVVCNILEKTGTAT
jgi:hypothetical protein